MNQDEMTFLYTATAVFQPNSVSEGLDWGRYIEWSKLTQLSEVVSLDYFLNPSLVDPDDSNAEYYSHLFIHNGFGSELYTSLNYVLQHLQAPNKYNLLAVVFEPEIECAQQTLEEFEFVGYDLIDKEFCNSPLTNCGGFDEIFLPSTLNDKGLLNEFTQAKKIQKSLFENYPEEPHANTYIMAIWRHKTIGR